MDIVSLFCFLCVLPIAILFFFGLVIGILYYDRRKHSDAWREIARRAGLTFHAPGWLLGRPTLSGNWHGRSLRVYTITRGTPGSTGSTRTNMYIEMSVQLPANHHLELSERNFFSQLGRTGTEIPSGDVEFDQRFVARGEPADFVRQLLTASELRRLLLQARYVNIQASGEVIRYSQLNVETNADTMLFLFSLLFDLAEAIERY
jgi:hypothetical protein